MCLHIFFKLEGYTYIVILQIIEFELVEGVVKLLYKYTVKKIVRTIYCDLYFTLKL